jgi:hypothetical protein
MSSIKVKLGDLDYLKYKEMWNWCQTTTRGKWEAPNFNPWQYEGLLSNDSNIEAIFDFQHDSDAAMFKLTWFEA